MAFQPTRQKKYGVSPTGITQGTGLRAMSQAFGQIAQGVQQVSKAKRDTDFSNAMLEAELAGRNAVTRDESGNLKPLNNLNWDSGLLYTADRNRAFDAYKKIATSTYSTALKVETEKFSSNLFNENIKNPEGIITSGEAYIDKLEQELPEEVFKQVLPGVQTSFINKVNTAKANLLAFNKIEVETNAKTQLKAITNEMANLSVLNATTDATMTGDIELRLDELTTERNNLRDEFKFAGYTDSQVDEIINGTKQFVFARTSNEYIKYFYNENDKNMVKSLEEIVKVKNSLKGNPNVNIEQIETGMKQSLSETFAIKNEADKVYNAGQKSVYDSARLDIVVGDITSTEQVLALEDESENPLEDGYKASLLAMFGDGGAKEKKAKQNALNKKQANIWKNNLQALIKEYEVNEAGRDDTGKKIMEQIKIGQSNTNELIPNYDWGNFYGTYIGLQKNHWEQKLKEGNDIYMANVEQEMHEAAEYFRDPGYFREMTEFLMQKKIIGEHDGAYQSVSDWNDKVNDYDLKWAKNQRKLQLTETAFKNASAGLANDMKKLVELDGYATTVMVNGKQETIDPFSANQEIRKKSIENIVAFSIKYNTVHASILPQLQGFVNIDDEEQFRTAISVYSQIMEGFKKKKGNLRHSQGYHRGIGYFAANNVNTGLIEFARIAPYDVVQKTFATMYTADANRNKNKIDYKDEDENEYWKRKMGEATDEEGMFSWLLSGATGGLVDLDDVNPYQRALLDKFREKGNVNLGGAVFDKNGQLFTLMKNMAISKVVHGDAVNSSAGHKQVVLDVMGALGDNIGFSEQEDGEVYLSLYPFIQEFQKEMPSGMELTSENVFQNIRDTFNNMHDANGVLWSNESRELFEDGKFILIPNETYGEQVDYKVFVVDKYDNQKLLLDNYRYNYKTSRDEEAYKKGFETFNKGPLKKIWSAIPGMDDILFRQQVKKWQSVYSTKGVASKIIDIYNSMGNTLGGYNFTPIDPKTTEIKDDEWQSFFYALTSLGIK